jgi:RNA polymerase sigma-70 factor (ECF subfamily)
VSIQAASAHQQPGGVAVRAPTTAHALDFDSFYDQHFAFAWRTVRRLGIAPSAVDDVVQDVFVVVHRRLGDLESPSSARAWLFGIVRHVVKDARRTLRRKPAHLGGAARAGDDVDAVADASITGPHESAAKREAVRVLHAILEAMPDERREVFILSELEQMSVPDIAASVGANTNTVYSRLRAARADFERAVARSRAGDEWRMR